MEKGNREYIMCEHDWGVMILDERESIYPEKMGEWQLCIICLATRFIGYKTNFTYPYIDKTIEAVADMPKMIGWRRLK